MSIADLHYIEATSIASMLRKGEVSARELVAHQLERIARLDPELRSFAFLDADGALRQADEADALRARGETMPPLHGVPLGIKDLFWTRDMPTAAGMPIHRDFRPGRDATAVARLRGAGAILLGKLQMTEGAFALHHPAIAPPLNPWDPALWPGASSSGSGVATAAGLCFGSLGSDTGGSIRFPCAANGLTGLKPSWGRVSRHGTFELAASLDHIGPIGRSARDIALLLSVISGADLSDPTCWPEAPTRNLGLRDDLRGLRIGIDDTWNTAGGDGASCAAIEAALTVLQDLGADVRQVRVPDIRRAVLGWEIIAGAETAVAHEATYPSRSAEYGPALTHLIEVGRAASASDYQRALLDRMAMRGALITLMLDIDVLVAPVLPDAATTLAQLEAVAGDTDANARLVGFTAPFNLSGQPALSLPSGHTHDGMPIGMQFIAGHGREHTLLRTAMLFQQATAWHEARPNT